MKKYIAIGVATVLLLGGVTVNAAPVDPLNTLITILAKSLGLQNQYLEEIAQNTAPKGPVLGVTGSRSLRIYSSSTATTSPTYFGVGSQSVNNAATTSLLTVGCYNNAVSGTSTIADIDSMGLFLQMFNSSTTASRLLIQPQVSNDCLDWYDMAPYDQVTTAGTAVNTMFLPTASSSVYSWEPGKLGTSTTNVLVKNLAARAIRFRGWVAAASTSVWMQATAIERVTR